jgi:MFS family permease
MAAWIVMYGLFTLGAQLDQNGFIYAVLPLHGFCYTFFFVAGQLYVDEKAPVSLRNSAQGLIAFATYGVGKYLGTLVAGNVVDIYSTESGYNWISIWFVPFLMATVFLLGFIFLFKENIKKSSDIKSASNNTI